MTIALSGTPRVIMLDVDGTLAPIASHPDLAVVPAETREAIAALVRQPGVTVCIVSGRAAADARRLVGVDGVWVIGNHGVELLRPDGGHEVDPAAALYAGAMERTAAALEAVVARVAGAWVENKRFTLAVHIRGVADAAVSGLRQAVGNIAAGEGLSVRDGKKVIEVRPPVPVDKGTAVVALARRLGALAPGASVLFAGDDVTDEDAFRALRGNGGTVVTIQVGSEDGVGSAAEYRVDDPAAMRKLLIELAS
jgi:trehalose 6-phosphate phosphatase